MNDNLNDTHLIPQLKITLEGVCKYGDHLCPLHISPGYADHGHYFVRTLGGDYGWNKNAHSKATKLVLYL